jgi:hypothetical protein
MKTYGHPEAAATAMLPLSDLLTLGDDELARLREVASRESADRDEDFHGPYRVRFQVIDAILLDRRINR